MLCWVKFAVVLVVVTSVCCERWVPELCLLSSGLFVVRLAGRYTLITN